MMAIDILVPPLSQTMDTLVLVEWVKNVGDPVTKGEVLFTVETDKATLEVESPATGILKAILAQPGDEVKVGSSIGSIAEPGDALENAVERGAWSVARSGDMETPTTGVGATGPSGEALPPERQNRIFASPRARQLAKTAGVPLTRLQGSGTGPQHMIVERDVRTCLERQRLLPRATPVAQRMAEKMGLDLSTVVPAEPGATIKKADIESILKERAEVTPEPAVSESRVVKLTPTRKTIARRMHESHQMNAPVTYMSEVDATRLVRLRQRILQELPEGAVRPSYTDFLVRITARVLTRHPELNATFDGENVELHNRVHMALAVDTDRGLIVPVIRDADSKGLEELAKARHELVARARDGTVTPAELTGGTFTITNLGTLGIDYFTPIINPPQVAILGVGRIRQVPAVHKGKIRIRQIMRLALTCDHRIVDGAPAARFLQDICRLVENPDLIWM